MHVCMCVCVYGSICIVPIITQLHESQQGYNCLQYSANEGDMAELRLFIAAGANMNAQMTRGDGAMVMHRAAYRGHVEVVRLLLDEGCSIDITDKGGNTPLAIARDRGNLEVVALLEAAAAAGAN